MNPQTDGREVEGFLESIRLRRGGELASAPKSKTARARFSTRAAGGTVGIDQEVVTLRGLFGNSGSQRDLVAGRITTLTHR